MTNADRLRDLLAGHAPLEVPGCYDAFSARLIERAGHPAAYMSGFGTAASRLGAPDVGLLSFKEMADQAAAIADGIAIPLIADADTGYGGPANVQRTVRAYDRAGVAAIQIEDQCWPKRCGHTAGKQVLPRGEAVARIRAACDARGDGGILVVARTDARAVHGFDEALARCLAFADAGADVVFFEAPESEDEVERIAQSVDAPLLLNVIEGGKTPVPSRERLAELGYAIVIYPLTLLMVAARALTEHLGRAGAFTTCDPPPTFEQLRELVGFPEHDQLVERHSS